LAFASAAYAQLLSFAEQEQEQEQAKCVFWVLAAKLPKFAEGEPDEAQNNRRT
jgi:hypothetical protein